MGQLFFHSHQDPLSLLQKTIILQHQWCYITAHQSTNTLLDLTPRHQDLVRQSPRLFRLNTNRNMWWTDELIKYPFLSPWLIFVLVKHYGLVNYLFLYLDKPELKLNSVVVSNYSVSPRVASLFLNCLVTISGVVAAWSKSGCGHKGKVWVLLFLFCGSCGWWI